MAGESPAQQSPEGATCAAFSAYGERLVSGTAQGRIYLWDVDRAAVTCKLVGHQATVEQVAVSPDDRVVATASWDRKIKLWQADTGAATATRHAA